MKAAARAAARWGRVTHLGLRCFAAAALVLLALLLWRYWFGESGYFALRALEADVAVQEGRTASLAERNRALAAEVRALKAGPAAVEERARRDLGMVKAGETFYLVVDEAPLADDESLAGADGADEGRSP